MLTGAISCSILRPVVPKEEIHIVYKDSTVINTIDSIRFIPKEVIKDVVADYDTLKLETSLAKATAFVDTTNHILKGSIENKKEIEQKIKYVYKDRIIRDTTYIKEPAPYEVEKKVKYIPTIFKYAMGWAIISLILFVLFLLKKFDILKY